MINNAIHAYEKLSLSTAGIIMGIVLILLHLTILLAPRNAKTLVAAAIESPRAGQILLGIDVIWFELLMLNGDWNSLRMELFSFEPLRGILLLLAPIVWLIFSTLIKENLFARALGLFLLMLAIVPMTAAFLKDPITRLLIPIWWYPVLTAAIFWVGKPYLFRDWFNAIVKHPRLCRWLNSLGLVYGIAILICAVAFW